MNKKVCQLDKNGFFVGLTIADKDPVGDGYLLPSGAVDTNPPAQKDGFVAQWDGDNWQYIEDHRGETVYSTEDGSEVEVKEIGEYPANTTTEPRPTHYHTWWRGNWHLSQEAQAQQLSDAKQAKLMQAASKADAFIAQAAGTAYIPEFEQKTWALQAVEAKAWHKDNSAETPLLDNIAVNRGVDRETLIKKALQKALAYEVLTASIAGQRQKIEDAITAADNLEALESIEIAYHFEAANG